MNQSKMQAQSAYAKTIEQMNAPAKIDPDRWWNARGASRQIFVVLSAALSRGATLPMFQHAIDQDVETQQHDIDNAQRSQQAKASGQHNIMQMARENGLDLFESQKTAKAFAWDQIMKQAKVAEMNTSSQVIKTNAIEVGAIAQQNKIKEESQLDQHRQMLALEQEKIRMQAAHNKSMEGAAWTKTNVPKKEKPAEMLKGPQVQELADLESAKQKTKELAKDFGHPGLFQSLWDKASSAVDNSSKAGRFNQRVKLLIQNIGPGMGSGVLGPADLARWDDMAAKAGTRGGDESWRALVDEIETKLKNRKTAFTKAGFRMDALNDKGSELSDEDTASALGFEEE